MVERADGKLKELQVFAGDAAVAARETRGYNGPLSIAEQTRAQPDRRKLHQGHLSDLRQRRRPGGDRAACAGAERFARHRHQHAQDPQRGNLVAYTPYEGVRLTGAGNALALRVVRRHRLIELFLVNTLNLSWDEVHEEAEHMEHAVSDRLVDKIDAFLGHPPVDPHGDPIPRPDGTFETPASRTLAECQAGEHFRLARVLDQSPEFLRFLSSSGLPLGASGQVTVNSAEAGIVTVRVEGQETTLGRVNAEKILVTSPKAAAASH
jgi:DtxR family Mn-dependent transcriptional regulator